MTIWDAMEPPINGLMAVAVMLLLLWNGYLCLLLAHVRESLTKILPVVLSLLVLFALLFLFLDGMFHYGESEKPRTWSAVTTAFCSLPVFVPFLIELVAAIWLLLVSRALAFLRKIRPTPDSVKETVDLLPAGIAFADEDGQIVFSNLTMDALSRATTGRALTNLYPLLNRAKEEENTEPGTPQTILSDGTKVWKLFHSKTIEEEKVYSRLAATDVTALTQINDALRNNHNKLRELRLRLEDYSKEAEQIILSQELLNARMQVHNETGHILLASRRFMENPAAIDETTLLQMLTMANTHLLKECEKDDTWRDPLTEVIETEKTIGVTVHLCGAIPEKDKPRTILAAAIRECGSNLRKHANGDCLKVHMEETGNGVRFTLSGNGRAPEKPISETGGLFSLRTLVETAGGTMTVANMHSLTIVIDIPE